MSKALILLITSMVFLSGCWDQKIYEQIGFTLQLGVELSKEEGSYLISATSPIVGEEKEKVELLSTSTKGLLREARENRNRMTAKLPEAGRMQQILFSSEVAENGIHEFLEIFERVPFDPEISHVVIVDGSPYELLKKGLELEDKPRIAVYIAQLLEGNIKSYYIPDTTISEFDINYFAPGIDPIAPLIKLSNNEVLIMGSALFKGDKMVGKINHIQTSLLLTIMGLVRGSEEYITSLNISESQLGTNKKKIATTLKTKKRNVDIKFQNNKPVVNISLKLTCIIDEYSWDDLDVMSTQTKLEKILAEDIEKQCTAIIKYIQQSGSDPIGIGNMIRAKYNSYWNSIDWDNTYKDCQININIDLEIIQYGTIN